MGIFRRKSTAAVIGAVCASVACVAAAGGGGVIPESMKLTQVMKEFNWGEVPLVPIDFNIGIQLLPEENAQEVIEKNTEDKPLDGFDLFGIVKETGVDDAGLEDFHKDYFPYPIYQDLNWGFYEAFGNRSFTETITWNPFKLISALIQHNERFKEKGLKDWNLKGEGLRTGGVIIFGKDGSPQFMVPEVAGDEINEDELLAALETLRNGGNNDGEL